MAFSEALKISKASYISNKGNFYVHTVPELRQHICCTFFSWKIATDFTLLQKQTIFIGIRESFTGYTLADLL